MKKMIALIPFIILGMFMSACNDDDNENGETATIQLTVSGLPTLDDFHKYEGWIIVDGSPITIGRFSVDEAGQLSETSFEVDAGKLEKASAFIISIEPEPDNNAAPTKIHILAGNFIGNSATLTVENESALGTGFGSVAGKYILATPTDGEMTNENSGIWWLVPGDSPSASLQLPELNEGWLYEGWVVINGTPVSTGKFSDETKADMAAPYSATLDAPPFPGEDFLRNAPGGLTFPTDLSGQQAVISVEPEPDNSNKPFAIKPLIGNIPQSATDHTLYNMTNNSGSILITGEVMR
jgi:hypothetical protein